MNGQAARLCVATRSNEMHTRRTLYSIQPKQRKVGSETEDPMSLCKGTSA